MPDGSRSFSTDHPEPEDLARVAALYREHHAFVWRVLQRCGVAPADLDDAVQETFIVVHRKIGEFEGRATERTWLYAVAVRVASTFRRSARREEARRDKAGSGVHGALQIDPEAELSRVQAQQILYGLLDELDEHKRTVFVLAELEGVRVPEISQILGVNVRTVHSRLRLARERFDAAIARHQAREQGRLRRSRLRARALAERARDGRPSARASRATWAALAVRLKSGASPMLAGWQSLTLASSASAPFFGPLLITVAVGLGGVGIVAAVVSPAEAQPDAAAGSSVAARSPAAAPVRPKPTASARAESEPEVAEIPPSVELPAQSTPPTRAGSQRIVVPQPRPSVDDDLAAETRLLERARTALAGGDVSGSLDALDEHAKRFERGVLASERASTRLRALCAARRQQEAEALARRLTKEQPDGRWLETLQAACGPGG